MPRLVQQLYRRMPNAPVRKATKDRQANDKRLDAFRTKKGGAYSMMSDKAKKEFDQAYNNLKKMSPAERARFYKENSLWISRVFDYYERDDEGNVLEGQITGKNQLGKKMAAFRRATEKQYTQTDLKSMRRWEQPKLKKSKVSKSKKSKPSMPKMQQPKLTVAEVDAQIADLERQLMELKKIRSNL